jgi:hypothetical protein
VTRSSNYRYAVEGQKIFMGEGSDSANFDYYSDPCSLSGTLGGTSPTFATFQRTDCVQVRPTPLATATPSLSGE